MPMARSPTTPTAETPGGSERAAPSRHQDVGQLLRGLSAAVWLAAALVALPLVAPQQEPAALLWSAEFEVGGRGPCSGSCSASEGLWVFTTPAGSVDFSSSGVGLSESRGLEVIVPVASTNTFQLQVSTAACGRLHGRAPTRRLLRVHHPGMGGRMGPAISLFERVVKR